MQGSTLAQRLLLFSKPSSDIEQLVLFKSNSKLFAPATLAFSIPVITELLNLGRSMVLANGLPPAEMGKVIILLLILRAAEVSSNFSGNVMFLQADDGDDVDLQNNLQGFAILRGFVTSILLILLGSMFFASLDDAPGFSTLLALGIIPALQGFVHLDYKRRERHLNFKSCAIVDLGATAFGLIIALICVNFIPHHSIIAPIIMSFGISWLLLSHFVASRKYQFEFNAAYMNRIVRFGLPLLASGILGILIMQGDRVLVARYVDWEMVAQYGIAAHIALTPLFMLLRAGRSLAMPRLRVALEKDQLSLATRQISYYFITGALIFLFCFSTLYNPTVSILYGENYQIPGSLVFCFALLAGLRIIRLPLNFASLTLAKTEHSLYATTVQSLGLALGWYWLSKTPDPMLLVVAAILSEALALITNLVLLSTSLSSRRSKTSAKPVTA